MIKQKYDTNFGAIWNLISNRNYTKPLLYKSLYLLYYFITITVVLELLFDKTYMILAVISSIIIVINGRINTKEDIVELQERFNTTDIEKILLSIMKGEKSNV